MEHDHPYGESSRGRFKTLGVVTQGKSRARVDDASVRGHVRNIVPPEPAGLSDRVLLRSMRADGQDSRARNLDGRHSCDNRPAKRARLRSAETETWENFGAGAQDIGTGESIG